MANQYKNKVIYGGQTLIDLTQDDVTAADVQSGKKFHLPSGALATTFAKAQQRTPFKLANCWRKSFQSKILASRGA